MKLIDSSLPLCGKLNDAGTMTSGSASVSRSASPCRPMSVLLASMSAGRTMKRSPATNAVISASRGALSTSPCGIGVSAATRPGSTQRLTSNAIAT